MTAIDRDGFLKLYDRAFDRLFAGLREVTSLLRSVDPPDRFHLLHTVLCERRDRPYIRQKIAAALMMSTGAGCPLPLHDALRSVRDTLDHKVFEYGYVLIRCFGVRAFHSELDGLEASESCQQRMFLHGMRRSVHHFGEASYDGLAELWVERVEGPEEQRA